MKRVDHIGKVFGRLTVVKEGPAHVSVSGKSRRTCEVNCQCGNSFTVLTKNIVRGYTVSCGCYRKEIAGNCSRTHGLSNNNATYRSWRHMKERCLNVGDKEFKNYGGRGITVCDEWKSFENFYADMGEKPPGCSIERKDNEKGYSRDNCKWATPKEQARNRRTNVNFTINGETLCLTDWAIKQGIKPSIVAKRVRRGWSLERSLNMEDLKPEAKTCPKCHSGDYNQHFHEYDVNQAGSQADCSWWRCEDCDHESLPE